MTPEEKEMNEILKHLARSINFEKIEEFYSDPKNRETFEDWKRKRLPPQRDSQIKNK